LANIFPGRSREDEERRRDGGVAGEGGKHEEAASLLPHPSLSF